MDYAKLSFILLSIILKVAIFRAAPMNGQVGKVCEEQPRDLFLIVDDSASIWDRDFLKMRNFLITLVSSVNVARHMTRIGLLQFSDEPNTAIRFNLDNNFTPEEIREKVENLKLFGGKGTLTDLALTLTADEVFTKTNGDRPDVPDVAVVLTDGNSRYPVKTAKAAERLKEMGVRLIAIGVGSRRSYLYQRDLREKMRKELLKIASTPEDMKLVDFADLKNIVFDIVDKVCHIVTTPTPDPPVTTSPTTVIHMVRSRQPQPPVPGNAVVTKKLDVTVAPEITTTVAPKVCSTSEGKDILFLVDGTVNDRKPYAWLEREFRKVKRFIRATVRDLKDSRFRVGVMQYSERNTANMDVKFMDPLNMRELSIYLGVMIQQRGYEPYTGDALSKANNQFYELDALHGRENNPNVIVLITRRVPKDKKQLNSVAGMLESRNIRLITVAVHSGGSAKYLANYLQQLTSSRFNFVSKYKTLKNKRSSILDAICVKVNQAPRPGLALRSATCSRGAHDIFFVIDGSASIKYFNFESVQIFLMDLVSLLIREQSKINTGLMQFSRKDLTKFEWQLGRYDLYETIFNIRNMKYQAGTQTYTGDALSRVNDEVFTGMHGDRPGVPDILILFTDGNAHDVKVARKQAHLLKKKGVLLITIGAGTRYSLNAFRQELIDLASSPQYALTVDFENLQYFAEKVFPLVCNYMRKTK